MSIHKGKNGYGDPSNSHVDYTVTFFPYICVIGWHMENCAKHSPLKITVKKKHISKQVVERVIYGVSRVLKLK